METTSNFRPRIFRFSELALLYFPDTSKAYACRLLRTSIQKSSILSAKLIEAEHKKYAKILTPKQVSIIVSHLGEP